MTLHTIGDVARIAGVSTKAIRFWEERGLLTDIERTPSGYRIFGEDDLLTIHFIHQAQVLGLTLGQIQGILGIRRTAAAPCEYVLRTLDDRVLEIDQQIGELVQLRDTLNAIRNRAGDTERDRADATFCQIIEGLTIKVSDSR